MRQLSLLQEHRAVVGAGRREETRVQGQLLCPAPGPAPVPCPASRLARIACRRLVQYWSDWAGVGGVEGVSNRPALLFCRRLYL